MSTTLDFFDITFLILVEPVDEEDITNRRQELQQAQAAPTVGYNQSTDAPSNKMVTRPVQVTSKTKIIREKSTHNKTKTRKSPSQASPSNVNVNVGRPKIQNKKTDKIVATQTHEKNKTSNQTDSHNHTSITEVDKQASKTVASRPTNVKFSRQEDRFALKTTKKPKPIIAEPETPGDPQKPKAVTAPSNKTASHSMSPKTPKNPSKSKEKGKNITVIFYK